MYVVVDDDHVGLLLFLFQYIYIYKHKNSNLFWNSIKLNRIEFTLLFEQNELQ